MLEPRGQDRTDGKRPEGVTITFEKWGNSWLWDVTFVDALGTSCLKKGSLCYPRTTTSEAEAHKTEKYRELLEKGCFFQPVAMEVLSYLVESSEVFITLLRKKVCRPHDNQQAGSVLKQRISMTLQIRDAACVLGNVSGRDALEKIYNICLFFQTCLSFQQFSKKNCLGNGVVA